MNVRVHMVVCGFVQGVGFRYFVLNRALSLGIFGYVRNLYTGEVEIEAEGNRSILEEFIKEVKIGPRSAHVTDLKIEWMKWTKEFSHFEVR